jgi:hypothetical protein
VICFAFYVFPWLQWDELQGEFEQLEYLRRILGLDDE